MVFISFKMAARITSITNNFRSTSLLFVSRRWFLSATFDGTLHK